MAYTIKLLKSEEFDKLPFSKASDPDALGVADPKTMTAYIRDTGYNDVTKMVISHELDELMAKEAHPGHIGPDGERYFLSSLFSMLGNLGRGAMSGLGALGRGAMSGLGAIGRGVGSLGSSMWGGLKNIGGGVMDMFRGGGAGGAQAASGAGAGAGSAPFNLNMGSYAPLTASNAGVNTGVNSLLAGGTGSSIPGFAGMGSYGSAAAAGAAPSMLGGLFKQAGTTPTGTTGMPARTTSPLDFSNASAAPTAPQNWLDKLMGSYANATGGGSGGEKLSFMDSIKQQAVKSALGMGTSYIGDMFGKKVDAPDYAGLKENLQSEIDLSRGTGSAYDLGFGEAQNVMARPIGEVPQELYNPIDRDLERNIAALEETYRKAQGSGANAEVFTSEFGKRKAELLARAEEAKAKVQFDYSAQQRAEKIDTMKTLLNLDDAQYNQIMQLAQLDVAALQDQYGLDLQEAAEFKQLFSDAGQMMAGAYNPSTPTA